MSIVVTLRKDNLNMSYYKEILLSLLNSGVVDNILISSGYFSENENFKVSEEKDSNGKSMVSCLSDGVITSVIVVGAHSKDRDFFTFIEDLKKECKNVIGYYHKENKWHAKICILRRGDRSLAGIIGSSNLTGAAYSHNSYSSYESDAFIFSKDKEIDALVTNEVNKLRNTDNNYTECVLLADFDPQKNGGLTEEEVLDRYYKMMVERLEEDSIFEKIV